VFGTGSHPLPSINVPFLISSRGGEFVVPVASHTSDSEVKAEPAQLPLGCRQRSR
jgi:hypothetical protein